MSCQPSSLFFAVTFPKLTRSALDVSAAELQSPRFKAGPLGDLSEAPGMWGTVLHY